MMDVDHFKSVNDRFGHAIGDFVLREISKRLQSVIRQDDVLARFGGEEFAIVLVEANAEDAALIAETCRKEIAKSPLSSPAGDINLTVSLGVVSPEAQDLGTASELLHDADQRLYEAKHGGRNRTVF
jgi:diguanylate cyclase (GGDEF)-like protein